MAKKKASLTTQNAPPEGPRLFEFREGNSDKFWEIELQGNSHTVRYGRIGTNGQTKTKEFADSQAAQTDYQKLIQQKTKKGYTEIVDSDAAASTEQVAQKQLAQQAEPFLQAIQENPDELVNYSAFADWLIEQGEPRGEFMQVQLALEDESLSASERKELQKREKELLKANEARWLGDLSILSGDHQFQSDPYHQEAVSYRFERGLFASLCFPTFPPEIGRMIRRSPLTEELRELIIEDTRYVEETFEFGGETYLADEDYGVSTLVGAKFPNLRTFRLGEDSGSNQYPSCHTSGEHAVQLIKQMPRLETLHLEAHRVDTDKLFKLKMPALRSLTVHHLHHYPLDILAKNSSLKNLRALRIFPHGLEYGDDPYIQLGDIQAIARSKHLQNLEFLQLRSSDFGDAGIEEIIQSGLLKRLKILDLCFGCVTDQGAQLLAAAPETKNLSQLVLNGNGLTNAGINALKATGVRVEAKEQLSQGGLQEREYLWYGDPE